MDDQVSEYSTSQASKAPESEAGALIMQRKPMTKKELQAFMKAKLAKTKVTDQVTTQASATGPGVRNFA